VALAAVRARVTARFALPADDFADRLLVQIAARDARGSDPLLFQTLALDDLYLAMACADGDENAWRELEARHFPFIRDFARRLLPGGWEDVAAQVIADLWQRRKIAQYEGRSSLRTWLGAVVMRTVLNARGGRLGRAVRLRRSEGSSGAVPDRRSDDRASDDGRTLARLIARALERLEAEDRLVLLLYYEQGLTLEQMEPTLRVSKATLSRRLKRVRERLFDDVSRRAREEMGIPVDRLRRGLERAAFEFDLADALRVHRLQGNERDGV
jgi:RNA polymerase sigma-70 factor (ECF subfamily)